MPKSNQVIIAYVPVLHAGYRKLFDAYPDATIYVFGIDIIGRFDQLRKDLRALKPEDAVKGIKGWGREAHILDETTLSKLTSEQPEVIIPDEDVTRELVEPSFKKATIEPIFLRWDRRKMEADKDPVNPDHTISLEDLDKELLGKAAQEAAKSTNIWRRVGGLIAKDGETLLQASNQHQPVAHANWTDGDPRNNANRGTSIEVSTDMHAEARLIAEAAKQGIALAGADIYLTTFPCPTCAKLVANAGIKRCYYATGYAMLDGEEVLKAHKVELIHVEGVNLDTSDAKTWLSYPEKPKK